VTQLDWKNRIFNIPPVSNGDETSSSSQCLV